MWDRYSTWATANKFLPRNPVMGKKKFDRLSNVKKSTGDPSCPPEVRRAKRISPAILGRDHAATSGWTLASDDEAEGGSDSLVEKSYVTLKLCCT